MKIRVGFWIYAGLAVALSSLLPSAQASITSYSNQSSWQANNPSSTLQDFNSVASGTYNPYSTPAVGTIQTTQSYTDNSNGSISSGSSSPGVTTQSSPSFGTGQYLVADADSYNEYVYNGGYTYYDYYEVCGFGCGWDVATEVEGAATYSYSATASMVLTPPSGTTALGFEVGQAENSANQNVDITATVTTADNETQTLTEDNTYGSLSFFGFDASDPITSVVITEALNPEVQVSYTPAGQSQINYYNDGNGTNSGYDYYVYNSASYEDLAESQLAFDNLMYASPVPEPASFILLGTALFGVGLAMRKRLSRPL